MRREPFGIRQQCAPDLAWEAARHRPVAESGRLRPRSARGAPAATGLTIRHDHGSQYMSDDFQAELRFLGIVSSPAFVRQPEGNGCIERFFRTLKEQLLQVRHFRDVEDLQQALRAFKETYNQQWLIERLGFRAPAVVRREFALTSAA